MIYLIDSVCTQVAVRSEEPYRLQCYGFMAAVASPDILGVLTLCFTCAASSLARTQPTVVPPLWVVLALPSAAAISIDSFQRLTPCADTAVLQAETECVSPACQTE